MVPKVSVVMAVYNAAPYLEQSLESILNQSLYEIEVICVDDGSTDNSLELLESFAEKDTRIKVISQTNQTAGAARNRGIEIASGEYLSILDVDDFFEKDMLKNCYEKAERADADVVVYRSDRFDMNKQQFTESNWTIKREYLPEKEVFSHRDMSNIFYCFIGWAWDKLFRRSFIVENGITFQQQRSINDLAFVFCALSKAERITVINEIFAHKRHNTENAITTNYHKSGDWHCFYQALMALKQRLEMWQIYDELRIDFVNYALYFSFWNLKKFEGIRDFNVFYETLKNQWLRELDILNKGEEFFFDKEDYLKLTQLLNMDAKQYLYYQSLTGKDGTYLFPFEAVEKGAKIVLYGAGNVGQAFYRQIVFSSFCHIVAWVDCNYMDKGEWVSNPTAIFEECFDYLVVAINDSFNAEKIIHNLVQQGVMRNKIIWRKPEVCI